MFRIQYLLFVCFFLFTQTLFAENLENDKSNYNLFNPTPDRERRGLSPDRPDATESPITVDAGAYVLELSFFDWRREGVNNSYTALATNLKVGLTDTTDLQVVFDAYTWEDTGATGFSDVQFRLKWNIWGNDTGNNSLALFPFIKIPTYTELSNSKLEGGLIIPFSVDLTQRFGLGLMAEIDVVYEGDKYEVEVLHSAVLGIDLLLGFGAFAEYIGIVGMNKDYEPYVSGGITLKMNEDLVFDVGTQIGLSENADDFGLFGGITLRFM